MTKRPSPHLLKGLGIEIEYMIVRKDTLDVLPVSDTVLRRADGACVNEYVSGDMGWSNEFVLHVMELKNRTPLPSLNGLSRSIHGEIMRVNRVLKPLGALLMPSGMHPWMNPGAETKMWHHRYRKIYATYDRIFNCRRHGWANLQSIHVNISFRGDVEFAKLHAAIRLLIPVIPALAASSPVAGGRISGYHDTRLVYYRSNQRKVPSVMGRIIPEPVYTEAEYRKDILEKMYRDIAAHDPEGTIRHEWLNSRGAIPRFERNAFEIRVIDTQECPGANIAVSELIVAAIQLLVSERWASLEEQRRWAVSPLVSIFRRTIRSGETALINDARYLAMFGFPGPRAGAGEVWGHLAEEAGRRRLLSDKSSKIIRSILDQGTLSSRILRSLEGDDSHARLKAVYGELCRCLARNEMYTG